MANEYRIKEVKIPPNGESVFFPQIKRMEKQRKWPWQKDKPLKEFWDYFSYSYGELYPIEEKQLDKTFSPKALFFISKCVEQENINIHPVNPDQLFTL